MILALELPDFITPTQVKGFVGELPKLISARAPPEGASRIGLLTAFLGQLRVGVVKMDAPSFAAACAWFER
jgi:hypothetical protein